MFRPLRNTGKAKARQATHIPTPVTCKKSRSVCARAFNVQKRLRKAAPAHGCLITHPGQGIP